MSKKLKSAIIAALVALIAGFAVSYGLISQQTADEIKAKTEEILTDEEAAQPAPDTQPTPDSPSATHTETAPQAPTPPSTDPQQAPQQEQ